MYATMSNALKLEFDNMDDVIQEVPGGDLDLPGS